MVIVSSIFWLLYCTNKIYKRTPEDKVARSRYLYPW